MSAPSSVEELLQLIRKSGMVEEAKLTNYLVRRQKGRGMSVDPREAADAMVSDGILTNFQAEQFLLGKWRGFTIGKFKLLERVGVGGMGQVFLCEHMFMKRRVAIKVLPPAKAEQPAALGRFYREARAAGSLEHPNIVRTHDIDQDGNLHFIVMEYVDGSNLLEMVKKFGPMNIGRAACYVSQVATALDFAFKSGIIHRDVKPGNILVDRKGLARILDMGLARFYKDQSDMLTVKYDDKIVLGTADYVAPEQVANSHAVDVRADIYALGATLYFLLAGHPAFPTGTVSQKLLWHRTKEPTPIRQIRPEIPELLADIVARMMAKDPNARFQTPAEVVTALAPLVPATVPPPSPAEMPQLCPAITEANEQQGEAPPPPPEPPVSQSRSRMAADIAAGVAEARASRIQQSPFGSATAAALPSAPPAINPFGPGGPSGPPPRPITNDSPFGQRPAASPPQSGERNGMQGVKPLTAESTPLPVQTDPYPRPSRTRMQNPMVMPPANNEMSATQKFALYAILGVTIIVSGGVVVWKLLSNNGAAPAPAPIVTTHTD